MGCSKEYLVSLYIDGQLSEKQEQEVREHLLKCRHCKKVYEDLNKLQKLLDKVEEDVEIVEPTHEESLLATRRILKLARELKEKGDTGGDDMPSLTQFPQERKSNKRKLFYAVSSLAASIVLAVTLSVIYFDKIIPHKPIVIVESTETPGESSTLELPPVVESPPNNQVVLLPKESDNDSDLPAIIPEILPPTPVGDHKPIVEPPQPTKPDQPGTTEVAEAVQVDENKKKEPVELQIVVSQRFYPAQFADAGSSVNVSYQPVINEYGEKEYKYDPTGTAQAEQLEAVQHIKEFKEDIVKLITSDKVEGVIIDDQSKDILIVDIPKRNLKWFADILKTHGKAQMISGPFVESIDNMELVDSNKNDLIRIQITLDISKDIQER